MYQINNTVSDSKEGGLAVCTVDLQENQKDVGYGIPQQKSGITSNLQASQLNLKVSITTISLYDCTTSSRYQWQ